MSGLGVIDGVVTGALGGFWPRAFILTSLVLAACVYARAAMPRAVLITAGGVTSFALLMCLGAFGRFWIGVIALACSVDVVARCLQWLKERRLRRAEQHALSREVMDAKTMRE